MIENQIPVALPPGFAANGTKSEAAGRWYDGNLVRFFNGRPQPIGGLVPTGVTNPGGYASKALAVTTEGSAVVVGGSTKVMALILGETVDITPAGFVTGRSNSILSDNVTTTGDVPLYNVLNEATVWHLAAFGNEVLGINNYDGNLYKWTGDVNTVMQIASGAAPQATGVVVTPERFVVLFGFSADPNKIQWPSQEGYTDWTPSPNNTAGDLHVDSTGHLVTARRGNGETLLWTTDDLQRLNYVGEPFIYGLSQVGTNCGLLGPNAVAMIGGTAFWMGRGNDFFMYDGGVRPLPCEVSKRVFGDFNEIQRIKVWTMTREEFHEVWWFYPSASSVDCDRYVVYNYVEGHWVTGQLTAACGVDAGVVSHAMVFQTPQDFVCEFDRTGVTDRPVNIGTGNYIYAWVESGPLTLGSGNQTLRIQRIIPDEGMSENVTLTLETSMFPDGPVTTVGPLALAAQTDVRTTAKLVSLKYADVATPVDWQVGTVNFGVMIGGTR